MTTLAFVLLLAAVVLASSVINQIVRGVSTPLIQIALGALVAVCGYTSSTFTIDPELFLVLFIAPLLYDEARSVNKVALWSNRTMIVSLAVGLVLATLLVVGFALNFVEPSIPLAAAFALGAALGPTDAVAVASLSQRASLNERQETLLSGESLINDASGVVSFQFAVMAFTTGTFSVLDAAATFSVSFFGGILLGLVLAVVLSFCVARVRELGLEDTTFHVLFDVLTPFVVFLIAESVHVSGILAVVAAGLANSYLSRDIGPSIARMKIVSSSVWRVLGFVLNGVVFVLLGMQLPTAMSDTWAERSVSNGELILLVLMITALVIGVRALWFMGISYSGRKQIARDEQENSGGTPEQVKRVIKSVKFFTVDALKESLALSIAGPKGAITLSIMFTLPYSLNSLGMQFSQRDFLIFLASGVILCTLLLANFVLPILLPKQEEGESKNDTEAAIDVLRAVIELLEAHQTKENRRATQAVMQQYNARIDRLKQGSGTSDDDTALRMAVLKWEQEYVLAEIDAEHVSPMVGYRMLRRIRQSMALVDGKRDGWWVLGVMHRRVNLFARSLLRAFLDKDLFPDAFEEERDVRELQAKCLENSLSRLRVCLNETEYNTEHVSALMVEIQRDLRRVRRIGRDIGTVTRVEDKATEVRRMGYALELEQIQLMLETGHINRSTAKHMRENVAMMQLDLEDKV